MAITTDERIKFSNFIQTMLDRLGSVNFDPDATLWHYTNGTGMLGILESGQIYATQVACLNDSTETTYATSLFKAAITEASKTVGDDDPARTLLKYIDNYMNEDTGQQGNSPSKFFVTCFSTKRDDLTQWRAYSEPGGQNGYAIGFKARGLFVGVNSLVVKVNYDKTVHTTAAKEVADATLRFFREGLESDPTRNAEQWAAEFFEAWDEHIYRLAPMIKDGGFESESEFRIVYELQPTDIHKVRFRQKQTLLSRYIQLNFPLWMGCRVPVLPITGIIVGPSRQREVSRVSVSILARQMGYGDLPVQISDCPLQLP